MGKLITTERLIAAGHINRWRGWTTRPFSILEHMVLGTTAASICGWSKDVQLKFLVHDLHETEIIGDVPTPHKRLYVNDAFHDACVGFDFQLGAEINLRGEWWEDPHLKKLDRIMRDVEEQAIRLDSTSSISCTEHGDIGIIIWQAIKAPPRSLAYLREDWWSHYRRLTA